jgi:hypothetical protein
MNEWAQASALLGAIDYVEGDPSTGEAISWNRRDLT